VGGDGGAGGDGGTAFGGAIYVGQGTITLQSITIQNNTATGGAAGLGGLGGRGGAGGAGGHGGHGGAGGDPSSGSGGATSSPNNGSPSTPDNGSPSTPDNGSPSTSNSGYPSTPNNGYPSTPNNGYPSTPNNGYPSTPNNGYPSTPNNGYPSTPNNGYPSTPNNGYPSTPNNGYPSTPNNGYPSTPNNGYPSTPNNGYPSTPNNGYPSTPNNGYPSTPNNGYPSTPNNGTPSTPDNGSPSTPNNGSPSTPTNANPGGLGGLGGAGGQGGVGGVGGVGGKGGKGGVGGNAYGGGIYLSASTLDLSTNTLSNNSAVGGAGGAGGMGGSGGAGGAGGTGGTGGTGGPGLTGGVGGKGGMGGLGGSGANGGAGGQGGDGGGAFGGLLYADTGSTVSQNGAVLNNGSVQGGAGGAAGAPGDGGADGLAGAGGMGGAAGPGNPDGSPGPIGAPGADGFAGLTGAAAPAGATGPSNFPETNLTTVTVTSNDPTSNVGQSVTLTATVADTNSGVPTGSVEFFDGSTDLGAGTLTSTSGNSASFALTTANLSAGGHAIQVFYAGTGGFLGSNGSFTQTVDAVTSTAVTSSNSSSTFGQPVTFTATVTNTSNSGGAPNGTIEFFDGSTPLGAGTTLSGSGTSATSTFTVSSLVVGSHLIQAVFTPNGDFVGSNGSVVQVVNAVTSTAVSSNTGSSTFGQPVTFTVTVTNTTGSGGAPTGTIEFFEGSTDLGPGSALTGSGNTSTSTLTKSWLSVGNHSIQAVFTPAGTFLSSSGTVSQTVNAATSTTVTAANPSPFGQAINFTATVTNTSNSGGVPTGSVEFFDGSTDLGPGTALSRSGTSTFTASGLLVGSHSIRSVFTPSGDFLGSSGSLTETVDAVTSTAVASNNNASIVGQPVTFTATVTNTSGNGGTPTGTVEFFDGSTDLGPGTTLAGSGNTATSTLTISSLTVGNHAIRAGFRAAGDFVSSSSIGSGPLTQMVDAISSTAVTSSNSSSAFGQSVTFTATVTNTSGAGGTPTGTIEFFDGSTPLGAGSALSGSGNTATSTFTISSLVVGGHSIEAVYTPSGDFVGGNGTQTQTVNAVTSTTVSSNSNPATFGQPVTFTATVTNTSGNGGAPTGTVEFFDGSTDLGPATLLSTSGNVATFTLTTSSLAAGSHSIRAGFRAAGDFVSSSSIGNGPLTQLIGAITSTAVSASSSSSSFGQAVTFTATVTNTSGNGGTPTGTIEFFDGSTLLGAVSALSGSGNTSTSTLTKMWLSVGNHSIRAVYVPSGAFAGSSSGAVAHTVNAVTSTAITSNRNPSGFGQAVTFTATVTNTSGNGGAPTGTVEFFDGSTDLGPATLLSTSGNVATFTLTTSSLAVGSHSIRAGFRATGTFQSSSSIGNGPLTQVVG
jgi:hypothetical protein